MLFNLQNNFFMSFCLILQKVKVDIDHVLANFPASYSRQSLLKSKPTDQVFDDWVRKLETPSRKMKVMKEYLANSVKKIRKFINWISQ